MTFYSQLMCIFYILITNEFLFAANVDFLHINYQWLFTNFSYEQSGMFVFVGGGWASSIVLQES